MGKAASGLEPLIGVLQTPALTSWLRRREQSHKMDGAEDGIRTRDLLLGKEAFYR